MDEVTVDTRRTLERLRNEQQRILTRLPADLVEVVQGEVADEIASVPRMETELEFRRRAEELAIEYTHWIELTDHAARARALAEVVAAYVRVLAPPTSMATTAHRDRLTDEVTGLRERGAEVRGNDAPAGIWIMANYIVWANHLRDAAEDPAATPGR